MSSLVEILEPPGAGVVHVWHWLSATWFGAGLVSPLRAGLAIVILIPILPFLISLSRFIVPIFAVAILLCGLYVSTTIEIATGVSDDRRIVIDEVAAFLLGASLVRQPDWTLLVPYAALFLLLDRLKLWPTAYLEQLPSGWGVMFDDLLPAIVVGGFFFVVQSLERRQSA